MVCMVWLTILKPSEAIIIVSSISFYNSCFGFPMHLINNINKPGDKKWISMANVINFTKSTKIDAHKLKMKPHYDY